MQALVQHPQGVHAGRLHALHLVHQHDQGFAFPRAGGLGSPQQGSELSGVARWFPRETGFHRAESTAPTHRAGVDLGHLAECVRAVQRFAHRLEQIERGRQQFRFHEQAPRVHTFAFPQLLGELPAQLRLAGAGHAGDQRQAAIGTAQTKDVVQPPVQRGQFAFSSGEVRRRLTLGYRELHGLLESVLGQQEPPPERQAAWNALQSCTGTKRPSRTIV